MSVDIHTHVIPAGLLARARTAEGLFGVRERDGEVVYPEGYRAPLADDFHDPAAILARMDRTGVDRSLLSLSPTLFFYERTPQEAVAFAREANDAIAELAAQDERLLALAQLPLQAPDAAAEELERAVCALGMRGAQIGTNAGAVSLDDARFDALYATAERLGAPLVLHPYFTGPKPRLEPFFLTNTIGNPLDTCIAATRLMYAGTLDRFPELRVVLVHGGGFLPYQLGRYDHAYRAFPAVREEAAQPPSGYLRRFWFDTITHDDRALAFLADLVGADRILLGTDLPYDMADAAPLERARRSGLDPDALGAAALDLFSPTPATTRSTT